jgi:hypothetical protein
MNKMVRQQVFMTAEQKKRLKSRAALTGTSISELVRRGIDRELEDKATEVEAKGAGDWKEGWRQAFGMWKDRDDIEEFYAQRRKRRRKRREETLKLMRGE